MDAERNAAVDSGRVRIHAASRFWNRVADTVQIWDEICTGFAVDRSSAPRGPSGFFLEKGYPARYGIFGINVDFLRPVKCGFFLRKKPLECVLSVYSNSENAIAENGYGYCEAGLREALIHFEAFSQELKPG